MADSEPLPTEPTPTPTQADPSPAVAQKPVPATWDEVFEHVRFKQLNEETLELRKLKAEWEAAEAKRQKETAEADTARLTEQKKFEELAEKRKASLDSVTGERDALKATVEAQAAVLLKLYEARKAAVPEMYQPLLDKLDVVERLDWIAANEEKLAPGRTQPNGITPTPSPQGKGQLTPDERRRRAAKTF